MTFVKKKKTEAAFADIFFYLVASCKLALVCLPTVLFPPLRWVETPPLQVRSQNLDLYPSSFSSLQADDTITKITDTLVLRVGDHGWLFSLTSNDIIVFDNVNGSTGTPVAELVAAASDSFCSLSLFFLFSS